MRKKILVIDDDGIVRDALNTFLTRKGFEVLTSADGVNGLLIFRNSNPDLVLLDRDMPQMTGSKVLEKIREISKEVPVVIITGFDSPADMEEYFKKGATAFLSKSNGLSPVLIEVDRILGKQEPVLKVTDGKKDIKILVVDDEEDVRNMVGRFLKTSGYKVIFASNGIEALNLIASEKPDIVFLDLFMPGKNGIEVLIKLKRTNPEIGIIMISGNEDEEIARKCIEFGAFDYISKPINLDQLKTSLATCLATI